MPSVPRPPSLRLNHDINVNGTFNVLMAAREARARRVVYAASSSAYGDTETLPKQEEMSPSPLALRGGETLRRILLSGLHAGSTISRPFQSAISTLGPRQDPSSPYSGVISKFITTCSRANAPVIYGDGEQSRDFTYVSNVVDANLRAAESVEAVGQVINLGIGERVNNQLLAELQKIIGSNLPAREEARAGDVRHSLAAISRARDLIGYRPLVGLAEGLRRTVEWYREGE